MSESQSASQAEAFAKAVSRLFGWSYTICWSASFYPQPMLNWRRRSTVGTTIDFPFLNNLGFLCASLSNIGFLYSPRIRDQYAARHPVSPEPTVQPNDLAFTAHAFLLSVLVYSMFWPFIWGFKVGKFQRASRMALVVFSGCIIGVFCMIIIVRAQSGGGNDPHQWAWIDVIYSLGYVKLIITVFKYIPQAWMNYKRKSTVGWSVGQILWDFAGGILSIAQLVIDSALQNDWSGMLGNPLKFGLANITMLADILFLTQHFILYRKRNLQLDKYDDDSVAETDPLLTNA